METRYYVDDDVLYVQVRDTAVTGGRRLDDGRHLDLDDAGEVRGVVLAGVSRGVRLDGIPEAALSAVRAALLARCFLASDLGGAVC